MMQTETAVDYINSWGPMILGHAYEPVVKAIRKKQQVPLQFGAPTGSRSDGGTGRGDGQGMDLIRMVNSGTKPA